MKDVTSITNLNVEETQENQASTSKGKFDSFDSITVSVNGVHNDSINLRNKYICINTTTGSR